MQELINNCRTNLGDTSLREDSIMKNLFTDIISSLVKHIDGPTFIKEFEDSSALIHDLETIANSISDVSVRDEIDMDIVYIKAGDQGEKNVYYELKNSFIPMLVLHNVVIKYDDYKAQMDYVVITNKFICILETKKLNGNITINTEGDFVRSFTNRNGRIYKKEGMYSPVSQNQRHVRILQNLMLQEKVIKKTPVLSLVVIANPKSIIDFKYAKKETKDQIVKYDQLTQRIKKMMDANNLVDLSYTNMIKIAEFLTQNHTKVEDTFLEKYRKHINVQNVGTEQKDLRVKELAYKVAEEISCTVEEKKVTYSSNNNIVVNKDKIREALVKFRLDQSRAENIKAYIIFSNNNLDALLERMPTTMEELLKCEGFGTVKVEKYGKQILGILVK